MLPGLIDAHTHIGEERELEQALVFGVTTELDMFTFLDRQILLELKLEQAAGRANDRADFFIAGSPVTCPGGLGTIFAPETPTLAEDRLARDFVEARIQEGSDHIKLMYDDGYAFGRQLPNLTVEGLTASIRAAHAHSKLAVVHVTSLHCAREAIAAGADGLAHIFQDEAADEELCLSAAAHHTFVIPTLTTLEAAFGTPGGAELAQDERLARYATPEPLMGSACTGSWSCS